MQHEDFEMLLRVWGRAFGDSGRKQTEDRSPTGNSTLASFGRPDGYVGVAQGRNGCSRRRAMGRAAGVGVLGTAYVNAVTCTATRTYKAPDYDDRITDEVEKLQSAWLALHRANEAQAAVVRVHYQEVGDQVTKAERIGVRLSAYKDSLRMAKAWMMGRMAA